MLRKITYLTLILSALVFSGCTSSSTPLAKKEKLVVGMSLGYAPIAYSDKNGKAAGLEADFAYALAAELNRELKIKILPWEQLPLALDSQVINIAMAGASITSKRKKFLLFSDPYMSISQMAVMRVGDSAPESASYGRGNRVGYVFSTTGESFVKKSFFNATSKGYTSVKQGIAAVMNREIDYFFHDAPSIWFYTAELSLKEIMGWYVPYTNESLAWAFSPKELALRDEVNLILKKWREDGTLNRMIQKWVRVQVVTPNGQKPISFE